MLNLKSPSGIKTVVYSDETAEKLKALRWSVPEKGAPADKRPVKVKKKD